MSQHNSLDWMDDVVSNSTTLAKSRSSLCQVWYVPAEMVRGGHSSCYSSNYNIVSSYWRQDCREFVSEGEELPLQEYDISAECRSRIQHQSWGTHSLSTLTYLLLVHFQAERTSYCFALRRTKCMLIKTSNCLLKTSQWSACTTGKMLLVTT